MSTDTLNSFIIFYGKKIIMIRSLLILISFLFAFSAYGQKTIKFNSSDGVSVSADIYLIDSELPLVLLFHQAGYSRGEYKEIAPRLNEMGFSCIAVDLRSGNTINGVKNRTATSAKKMNLGTKYLDAEPDMLAAIDYAVINHTPGVILVGSSYSAALVLKTGRGHKNVVGVAAFSPGEYFPQDLNLRQTIKGFKRPHFVTSSKSESEDLEVLVNLNYAPVHFIPTMEGKHGAKALWENNENHEEYWTALSKWLDQFKK